MATNSIDTSFSKQFEDEVHIVFQQMAQKLPATVRMKTNVRGTSTTFQKVGSGTAGTKSRNGVVPIANFAHTAIEVTISDYYLGEFVDSLDELKVQHDERQAVSQSIGGALARKADSLLTTAADAATNTSADATGGLTQAKVEEAFESLGESSVPFGDGNVYGWTSPQGWTDLMGISAFASADYVGADMLPFKMPMPMKHWFFTNWGMHPNLIKSGAIRHALMYHKNALAYASQQEISLDITWQGKEQAFLIVGKMSGGAGIIDNSGLFRIDHTEV